MTENHYSQSTDPEDQITLATLEALKVFFDPMRQKIVQEVANRPRTVHQIADALDVPFTRLYYHINLLEKHGIIRVVDVRQMPGAVEEKYYRISARMLVVDRSLLHLSPDGTNEGLEVVLSTTLEAAAQDIRKGAQRGVIDLDQQAPGSRALLTRRGVIRLTPERAVEFQEKLLDLIAAFYGDETIPESHYYSLVVAFFPTDLSDSSDDSPPQDGIPED